jgi:hypothetical protein
MQWLRRMVVRVSDGSLCPVPDVLQCVLCIEGFRRGCAGSEAISTVRPESCDHFPPDRQESMGSAPIGSLRLSLYGSPATLLRGHAYAIRSCVFRAHGSTREAMHPNPVQEKRM